MGIMQILSWRNFFEDGQWTLSQSGTPAAPYLEFLLLSGALINFLKPIEKYLAFEPQTDTECQLHSHNI
jgi:hypothetical protein